MHNAEKQRGQSIKLVLLPPGDIIEIVKVGQKNLFKVYGLFWSIDENFLNIGPHQVDGPYCANCYTDLDLPDRYYGKSFKGKVKCTNCDKKNEIYGNDLGYRTFVAKKYVSYRRSSIPKQSLDEPPTNVKVRDEDDKYFLAGKIGEKDGKRVGVIYFGEKNKDQKKEDYSQIFIDLDDEQVRFDKSNKSPKDILAKMSIEFKDSSHEENYKKKKN